MVRLVTWKELRTSGEGTATEGEEREGRKGVCTPREGFANHLEPTCKTRRNPKGISSRFVGMLPLLRPEAMAQPGPPKPSE